jgi:hypothetical protein
MTLIVEYFSFFLVVFVLIAMLVFYKEMDETNENETEITDEGSRTAELEHFYLYTDPESDQGIELIRAGSELNFEYTEELQLIVKPLLSDGILPVEYLDASGTYTSNQNINVVKSGGFPFEE